MSGRGDSNKLGTSGRGSSNQSNQGAAGNKKTGKSNHGEQTGGNASQRQQKTKDKTMNRNTETDQE